MDLEELKKKLRTYKEDKIILTSHMRFMSGPLRHIDEKLIKSYILSPESLIRIEEQAARSIGESKYRIAFDFKENKCLVMVIIMNHFIYVATAIIRSKEAELRRYNE